MRTTGTSGRGLLIGLLILMALPMGAVAAGPPVHGPDLRPAPLEAAAAAVLLVAPAIDFGQVTVASASTPTDYTYTNSTGSPQTVTSTIDGINAPDFLVTGGTCAGGPVADGSSCTVTITFQPSAEYTRTATLHVSDAVPTTTDVPLVGIGVLPDSNVVWGAVRNIGSAYTYTAGTGLARTVSGTTQYLHAIVQRYDVSRQGIYYRRSTNGATWSFGNRVNPSTQYAGRSSLAAAGSYVYAVWSSLASNNPSGTRPRALWFRSNRTNGSGTWATARRLTSATGRIDYPKIAASGSSVYVTYTDSATGYVKLLISHNHGSTWRTVTLGSTTRVGTSGRIGTPVVAAYGTTVAVAWISSASGIVKFRSSPNSGLTWTGTTWLGGTAQYGSWPSIAALGTRVAVSWTGPSAMYVRVRSGSVWSPVLAVRPSAGSLHDYVFPWIGQVALNGTARVAVAFEACWAGCASTDPPSAYRSDVLWRESATNGATWARSQLVIRSGVDTDSDYLYAYLPSVIWASATNRYVMAAHWYAPNLLDNVVVRAGVGSP